MSDEQQIDKSTRGSLERIANSLEMIALFLQVLAEGQSTESVVMTQNGPVEISAEEESPTAHVVETQDGLVELR